MLKFSLIILLSSAQNYYLLFPQSYLLYPVLFSKFGTLISSRKTLIYQVTKSKQLFCLFVTSMKCLVMHCLELSIENTLSTASEEGCTNKIFLDSDSALKTSHGGINENLYLLFPKFYLLF